MQLLYNFIRLSLLSLLLFMNNGCSRNLQHLNTITTTEDVILPEHLLYVVAMDVESQLGKKNELIVLDADTFETVNQTRLMDNTLFFKFSQDPLNHIWIGYGGSLENNTKRVDIFSQDGTLIHSMEVCTWPNVLITFAERKAFVPCYLNGFRARMAIVNLESFSAEAMLELEAEPRFSLLSAATNQEFVLVVGGSKTHTTMLVVDTKTMEIQQRIPLYGGGDIFTIIVHDDKFYLLNRGSSLNPEDPIDLRIVKLVDPFIVTQHRLAVRDPLLGFIDGEHLWTYHKPTAITDDGSRAISRTHISTGDSKYWPLPDYWWAGDMIHLNGKIMLTRRHSTDPNETDGLYEFNPETGQLSQILELPGAHLLLVGQKSQPE